MDYLIMRQAQKEFLTVGIDHTESQFIMGSASVDRILLHVIDEVVHPSHVPLIVKAQTVIFYFSGDLGPGGGFFCDKQGIRMFFLEDRIQMFQELDSFQVFISAVDIGYPFAVIFPIIQVKHGGHGVHTDPIGMILFCPEQRVGDQEIFHLRTSIIVDQSSPVRVHPLSGIQMLIQTCAVKIRKAEGIFGEVGRYPVQDHADPLLMHIIHKIHKVLTASVAAGGGIITCYLIAPGFVQRMFHNRHQFHMGISHFFYIIRQKGSDLSVIIKKPALLFGFSPGSQVHLIYRQWLLLIMELFSGLHPFSVIPLILSQIRNNRSRLRTQFRFISVRV